MCVGSLFMRCVQHYFAKAFSPTKNTIVDTVRILLEDLKVGWLIKRGAG